MFPDVFTAVQSSDASYGVIPFENSTHGSVLDTLNFLIDREADFPDILICGEAYLGIEHCLLGYASCRSSNADTPSGTSTPTVDRPNPPRPDSRPLASLDHITTVYSHPQAFGQCKAFLSSYLQTAKCEDVSSTSKAAEMVSRDVSKTTAAIASGLAAKVHGLDILTRKIQDRGDNQTRFFVLRNATSNLNDPTSRRKLENSTGSSGSVKWKTIVAFHINHHHSGALVHALQVYAIHGLNLTSINSRPSLVHPWHYVFLVEFEGRREEYGESQVNKALQELGERTQGWKWLGSWVDRSMLGPEGSREYQQ